MVKSHKELIGYQKAYQLVLAVYELTSAFPPAELYGLTSQMRRCAVSMPSNIAEGHMRGTKEYVQFLKIALGSAAELETQLALSQDLGYGKVEQYGNLQSAVEEVMKLLRTYINRMTEKT